MVDSIKKVSNPLTIIAIFAALAEVNSTVAIGLVSSELQAIFIWFIIAFPSLLIIFFFLTLNFNPKVIYAPSDFQNEENFLSTMSGGIYKNFRLDVSENDKSQVTVSQEYEEPFNDTAIEVSTKDKRLVDKANAFLQIFLKDTKDLFESNKLKGMGFGIKAEGLYLLSIKLNKELLTINKVSEYSLIIIVKEEKSKQISLEAIDYGLSLKENDISVFSSKVAQWLGDIVDKSI